MPEVIEIKEYSDFITKHCLNSKLRDIHIEKGRYKTHGAFKGYDFIQNSLPNKLVKVGSKGKFMYFKFENDYYLGITLGLTGGWFFKEKGKDDLVHGLKNSHYPPAERTDYIEKALKHININFIFENGTLYFYDQLSYGTVSVFSSTELLDKKLKTIGMDIFDPQTTLQSFLTKMKTATNLKKKIGNVLMDQKQISGIGNYLRADILYMSKISPFRLVSELSDDELKLIYKNSRVLIWGLYNRQEGINLGMLNQHSKLPTDYDRDFFVYEKKTDINGLPVIKEELYEGSQKRFIFWVPEVQK